MNVVFIGPDRELGSALESAGAKVARVTGPASAAALETADIAAADLLVLTDVTEATGVPVALEVNPALKVVVYAPDSLPEFVRGMVDFAVSPAVLDASIVAEELIGTG